MRAAAKARASTPTTIAVVRAELEERVAAWEAAGGAGVVAAGGADGIVLHRACGLRDREARLPMETDDGFDIGSITKIFTAAAVLELAAAGSLATTDTLARFFPAAPADRADVTVDQLVRHTSGLPDLADADGVVVEEYDVDAVDYELIERDELVRRALAAPMRSRPGERSEYSNLGYGLLGVIVELASGAPFEDFVREAVLLPAGLERTGYVRPGWRRDELAVGYRRGRRWGTPLDKPWLPDGPSWSLRSAGGFVAPAADVFRWFAAVAAGRALSPAAHSAYLDLFARTSPRGTRGHGFAGSNDVFDACAVCDLDLGKVVVATSSCAEEHSSLDIGRELATIAFASR